MTGFMRPEIIYDFAHEIELADGSTAILPGHLFGGPHPSRAEIADYVPSTAAIESIEYGHNRRWVGRLSAPGYLDCTDWIAADSRDELIGELAALYGDDIADELEADHAES